MGSREEDGKREEGRVVHYLTRPGPEAWHFLNSLSELCLSGPSRGSPCPWVLLQANSGWSGGAPRGLREALQTDKQT